MGLEDATIFGPLAKLWRFRDRCRLPYRVSLWCTYYVCRRRMWYFWCCRLCVALSLSGTTQKEHIENMPTFGLEQLQQQVSMPYAIYKHIIYARICTHKRIFSLSFSVFFFLLLRFVCADNDKICTLILVGCVRLLCIWVNFSASIQFIFLLFSRKLTN